MRTGGAFRALGLSVIAAWLAVPIGAEESMAAPTGRMAFVSYRDGNPEIYVMRSDGLQQTRVTFDGASDIDPDWAPDGSLIAFASDRSGGFDVYSVRRPNGTATPLTATPLLDEASPDWSSDGTSIVVAAGGSPGSGVGVVTRTGFDRLLAGPAQTPVWSPDRSMIAFVSNFESPPLAYWLYVMDADGTKLRRLDGPDAWDIQPSWSPDGSLIAFSSDQDPHDGDFEIYVIRPDGAGLQPITSNFTDEFGPAWSSDMTRIAYYSDRNPKQPNFDILVANADGSGEAQVTFGLSDDLMPDWRPAR